MGKQVSGLNRTPGLARFESSLGKQWLITAPLTIAVCHTPSPGNTLLFSAKSYPPHQAPALGFEKVKRKKTSKEKKEDQRTGGDTRGKKGGRMCGSR